MSFLRAQAYSYNLMNVFFFLFFFVTVSHNLNIKKRRTVMKEFTSNKSNICVETGSLFYKVSSHTLMLC